VPVVAGVAAGRCSSMLILVPHPSLSSPEQHNSPHYLHLSSLLPSAHPPSTTGSEDEMQTLRDEVPSNPTRQGGEKREGGGGGGQTPPHCHRKSLSSCCHRCYPLSIVVNLSLPVSPPSPPSLSSHHRHHPLLILFFRHSFLPFFLSFLPSFPPFKNHPYR
jgi:hypothetical protein